jgi:hypothetical protein
MIYESKLKGTIKIKIRYYVMESSYLFQKFISMITDLLVLKNRILLLSVRKIEKQHLNLLGPRSFRSWRKHFSLLKLQKTEMQISSLHQTEK